MAKMQRLVLLSKLKEVEILDLVGDSTSRLILDSLSESTKRFSELSKELKGKSSKTVSSRLKRLESAGLISKTLYAEVPPRAEYSLTEKGAEFVQIVTSVVDWDSKWA